MKLRQLLSTGHRHPIKDQVLEGRQFSSRAMTAFMIMFYFA